MAKRKDAGNKKTKQAGNGENGGMVELTKELWQAAVALRGSIEPADYKRYVLPIIFCGSCRCGTSGGGRSLKSSIADPKSDYFGDKKALHDPDEYRRAGAFVVPESARWENLARRAGRRHQGQARRCARDAGEQIPGQAEGPAPAHVRRLEPRAARVSRAHQPILARTSSRPTMAAST